MPRLHLTSRVLQALSTTLVQESYSDAELPGFRVRVSRTGHKSFELVYRAPTGSDGRHPQRRLTLGSYPALSLAEARARARAAKVEIARGRDPQGPLPEPAAAFHHRPSLPAGPHPDRQAQRDAIFGPAPIREGSFADLALHYLERHAWRFKKRTRDDEGMLRRDLVPAWRDLPAAAIRRRDVSELLDRIVARGAVIAARRTRVLVSKIYNFGLGCDLVEHNPTLGVPAPGREHRRERWLTDAEICALWRELDRRGFVLASAFRVILLTLQRPGEVCSMRWRDLAGPWWTLPGERTKNGKSHRVYLSPPVLAILERLQPRTGRSEWVFESPKRPGQPIEFLGKVGGSICHALGFSFTPHDLRRTGATHLGRMHFRDEDIDRILNHNRRGVRAVYNLYDGDVEKQAALLAWGEHVEAIASGQPGDRPQAV